MANRPPIVTIMGHVDHGKTSLLDYIRKTKVTEKESGGITQHINAYQIDNPAITFVDTPGHAAFEKMRARGGQVADLVVLVIAANEGIKPQTEESLQHINQAQVPFLVAINKMDLPGADAQQVKSQLVERGHPTEDQGGKVIAVPVSAVTGQGVDELLQMIALLAETLELKGDPQATLEAVVIESELDNRRGAIANLIVRNGSLKIGQAIHAETITGKIKAMFDYQGRPIKEAGPSQPVQILGFTEVPPVGAQVHSGLPTDLPIVQPSGLPAVPPPTLNQEQKLPIIVKADVAGSSEAIINSLPKGIQLLAEGVGDISENDILLAKTSGAQVIGFHVSVPKSVTKLAETEEVTVKTFKIIYELFEYLADQYQRLIDPLYGIEVKAKAEILAEFKINKDRIAGGKVAEGELSKDHQVLLLRNGQLVKKTKIKSLRQGKEEVNKVASGAEFGAVFSPYVDFHVGDDIISY